MMITRAERGEQVQSGHQGSIDRGVYVYGIVYHREKLPEELPSVGDGEAEVDLASYGKLSALVSEVQLSRPLGTREDLLAHERVLDALAAEATVIPMRFGSVVSNKEAVINELLAPHEGHFNETLSELAGLVQFTVRGRYANNTHLREIVSEEPEIQELRAVVQDMPEDAGYAERLRLGELVNNAVVRKREVDTETLISSLENSSAAFVSHAVAGEDDAMHVAFLVDREAVAQFEHELDELGGQWGGRLNLRLIGPLAPYDFLPEA
ncbi:GvpL/GvpF family gas vesicle protein [Saccharopolyspora pogona]|uniref:GvpL/GvpF family gas vesicle protein n=1 Tax=Saccharopolyspora pogona TaxID=333966 RepID=UPI001CC22542|nr:GvpL/GvpF family gas vesicle protein [Saccharopolyspora pogona]